VNQVSRHGFFPMAIKLIRRGKKKKKKVVTERRKLTTSFLEEGKEKEEKEEKEEKSEGGGEEKKRVEEVKKKFVSRDGFVMGVKCHTERSVVKLRCKENHNNNQAAFHSHLHIGRTTKKRVKRSNFYITVNSAFDSVLSLCWRNHGDDWLCPPLRRAFRHMFRNQEEYLTKLCSFELWVRNDGNEKEEKEGSSSSFSFTLVAGELGYVVGAQKGEGGCYTSLTGATLVDSAGSVQMAVMGKILERVGLSVWDLGMPLDYKSHFGTEVLNREDFLDLYRRESFFDHNNNNNNKKNNEPDNSTSSSSSSSSSPSSFFPSSSCLFSDFLQPRSVNDLF